MAEILSEALPDLVVLVRRDGVIMGHIGGKALGALAPSAHATGERLESIWPPAAAAAVRHAVLGSIAARKPLESSIDIAGARYELRAFAQGPDRALCVIRVAATEANDDRCVA